MIDLFIDGKAVELPSDCSVTLSAALDEIISPGEIRRKQFPVRIPMTRENRSVLGFPEQALSAKRFNQENHTGKIGCKGTTLLQGKVELVRCENDPGGSGQYVLNLIVSPPAWISNASRKKLQDTKMDYSGILNADLIRQSWTNDSSVKFLPVKRDRLTDYGETQVTLSRLDYNDYFPFVQIKALLDAIAGESGYRIVSQFLNEPFFQSLYMSGQFPATASQNPSLRMDFFARGTAADKSTTADNEGNVYTSASRNANSVGNLVVQSDSSAPDNRYPPALYFGKSFQMVNNCPAFIPEEDVIAGFEFHMRFQAATGILSLEQLSGIAAIQWGDETLYEDSLTNPLTNVKNTGGASGYYWFVGFDLPSGLKRLRVYRSNSVLQTVSITSQKQKVSVDSTFTHAVLEHYTGGSYVQYSGVWGLFPENEYNSLSTREHDLSMRSQPRLRKKNEPVFFDTLILKGMDAGGTFKMYGGTTVRPLFYAMPGVGSNIVLSSVFAHETPQIKLIEAVAHLFGLHFYTDELSRTIYIEPRFTFLNETHEIDWTEKIDMNHPVVVEDFGADRHTEEVFSYKSEDAAVNRFEETSGMKYGAWSATVEHHFAREGVKNKINPLFSATFDEKNSLKGAPAASMIVVGNRNQQTESIRFSPKIVRYLGMKDLPAGQRWNWPSNGQSYPLVMFHSAGEDWFTLCFDDEGDQLGLKNYYQPLYNLINKGKKMILHLRLTPSDMEAILHPNSAGHNFRGHFVFTIRGEKIKGRLLEVSGYNPAEGDSTRCVFSVEL